MIGAVVLSVVALVLYLYTFYRGASALPPGPTPMPLLGNVHQLPHERPELTINQWARERGGIVTVHFGGQRVVVLTDYRLMREALVRNGECSLMLACGSTQVVTFLLS